jgi:hypothetical protein
MGVAFCRGLAGVGLVGAALLASLAAFLSLTPTKSRYSDTTSGFASGSVWGGGHDEADKWIVIRASPRPPYTLCPVGGHPPADFLAGSLWKIQFNL